MKALQHLSKHLHNISSSPDFLLVTITFFLLKSLKFSIFTINLLFLIDFVCILSDLSLNYPYFVVISLYFRLFHPFYHNNLTIITNNYFDPNICYIYLTPIFFIFLVFFFIFSSILVFCLIE